MAKTHKTGKTKIHKGRKVNEYSDGCWRYDGSGALAIRSPAWANNNITKKTAVEMQKRGIDSRMKKKQAAVVKATQEAMGINGKFKVKLPDDAAAYVAGELWAETLQNDQPLRDRVLVYERVGRDVGLVTSKGEGKSVQAIQVNINISEKATKGLEEEDKILDALWEEV